MTSAFRFRHIAAYGAAFAFATATMVGPVLAQDAAPAARASAPVARRTLARSCASVAPTTLPGYRYTGMDPLAAFNAADADGDLWLTAQEAANLPQQFHALLVDRNGDGFVTMQEYLERIKATGGTTPSYTVPGFLLRGASEVGIQPVEVIGREQLEARGNPTVEQLIRDLSEAGNIQTQANRGPLANGYGVTSANLRDLGSGRTLLTFNGVRLADDASNAGRDDYADAVPNAVRLTSQEPVSTFSIDVDTAAYSNVRRFLNDGYTPPADAVRVEELINYFDYGYATPQSADRPFRPFVAVAPSPWSPGRQLVHIGVQGFAPDAAARPPLNLVFLVDTSGSMASVDRLPLAQQALNILVDQLEPQDTVSLVSYAGSAGVVLEPTTGSHKDDIRAGISCLRSGGSTAGGAGLSLAYKLAEANFNENAVNRVILMTDGDFNVGVTDNQLLEDYVTTKRESGVYLSVYGFGRGNYQDTRMQTLAQNGNGTAAYVDTLREARRLFQDDFSGSMIPIADDVKIQVDFNPQVVAEYRLIGYETRMLAREDFTNDAVDAGEVGSGVAVTALYEITPVRGPTSDDPWRYTPGTWVRPFQPLDAIATLKIRFKAPGAANSRLIRQSIDAGAVYTRLDQAPEATRWATAVAAYGQKLRGDGYVSRAFTWDEALALAEGARGGDEFGQRAEFIELVRTARDLTQRNAGL